MDEDATKFFVPGQAVRIKAGADRPEPIVGTVMSVHTPGDSRGWQYFVSTFPDDGSEMCVVDELEALADAPFERPPGEINARLLTTCESLADAQAVASRFLTPVNDELVAAARVTAEPHPHEPRAWDLLIAVWAIGDPAPIFHSLFDAWQLHPDPDPESEPYGEDALRTGANEQLAEVRQMSVGYLRWPWTHSR